MSFTLSISILLLGCGSLCAIWLARYAWKRRPAVGSTRFSVLMLAISIWCFGYAMELLTPGITGKVAWSRVQYFGIALFPVAWLSFVLAHTGHWKLLRWRNIVWLSVIPAITLLFVLTNEIHHLIWVNFSLISLGGITVLGAVHGFWFWINVIYTYLVVLVGFILLITNWRQEIVSLYRGNAVPLVLSIMLLPWLANIAYIFNITPIDLTPFTFLIAVVMAGHYILRFRVFDMAPIAQNAIVNSISEPLFALDTRGRLIYYNEAAQPLLGKEHLDWIGRTFSAHWPELANLPINAHSPITLPPREEGESPVYYEAHVVPLYDGAQRRGGRLITLQDVTVRQQQEALKDDLTHTMVHDMRAPITNTLCALELVRKNMEKDGTSAENERLLDMTTISTQKTLALVNQILDIGRLESERLPIEPKPFALRELVDSVVMPFEPKLDNRQIYLMCEVSEQLPLVRGDEALLGRVLQNLIDNSIKFSPVGGTIEVTARPLTTATTLQNGHGASKLLIAVTDGGPGIPAEMRDRVFDKYVAAGDAQAKGFGLGLAFCKMVLEAHGEKIWVENQPGAGASFRFTLPLVATAERAF